jgi:hypothetical protein
MGGPFLALRSLSPCLDDVSALAVLMICLLKPCSLLHTCTAQHCTSRLLATQFAPSVLQVGKDLLPIGATGGADLQVRLDRNG